MVRLKIACHDRPVKLLSIELDLTRRVKICCDAANFVAIAKSIAANSKPL